MISILCPSRGRPDLLQRMLDSMSKTAGSRENYEVLIYLDQDDPTRRKYLDGAIEADSYTIGNAKTVGRAWNVLAAESRGDYLMMGNDDHVYITPQWDRLILDVISERSQSDSVFVAWVDDVTGKAQKRCAFPIVSRKWYNALGYFTPERFKFFYHDTWIWDIGKRLNRTLFIPEVLIEHRHFTISKAEYDDTYRRNRSGQANADKRIFEATANVRRADAKKLKSIMTVGSVANMYDSDYYARGGLIETAFEDAELLRPEQASVIAYAFAQGRKPRVMLSIGSGKGILEKFLEDLDPSLVIIGTDPSLDAAKLYKGSHCEVIDFVGAIKGYKFDTIILCAVLEHIPLKDIEAGIEELSKRKVRLVITNRLEYHPIKPNGWDHVTTIDDDLFRVIADKGSVVFRHGSHLVVDFPKGGVQ